MRVGTTDKTALLHLASDGTCLSCFRCSRNTRSWATVSIGTHCACRQTRLFSPGLLHPLGFFLFCLSLLFLTEQQDFSIGNTKDKQTSGSSSSLCFASCSSCFARALFSSKLLCKPAEQSPRPMQLQTAIRDYCGVSSGQCMHTLCFGLHGSSWFAVAGFSLQSLA